jgi:hypothetical protein
VTGLSLNSAIIPAERFAIPHEGVGKSASPFSRQAPLDVCIEIERQR